MERVYIAIGSNKGNREDNVIKAIKKIEKKIIVKKISSFIKTKPEEGVQGGYFLNGIIEVETSLTIKELFSFLQEIEKCLGRDFPHKRGEERTIDTDIIFYGNRVIKERNFIIPHPRYRNRYFVVFPLYEIAPDIKDPETGEKISEIYRRVRKNGSG